MYQNDKDFLLKSSVALPVTEAGERELMISWFKDGFKTTSSMCFISGAVFCVQAQKAKANNVTAIHLIFIN